MQEILPHCPQKELILPKLCGFTQPLFINAHNSAGQLCASSNVDQAQLTLMAPSTLAVHAGSTRCWLGL